MCNNTAFLCHNLTQGRCTQISLAAGITDLLVAVVCALLLLCLVLALKRGICDSPVKRLSLVLASCIILSALDHATLELFDDFAPIGWCVAYVFIVIYTTSSILMYLSMVLVIFLLQISAPIVPEHWKPKLKPILPSMEVIAHMLIPLLSLLYASLSVFILGDVSSDCRRTDCSTTQGRQSQLEYEITPVLYILLALPLLLLFILMILLSYFCIRYHKTRTIIRRTKWPVIKMTTLVGILCIQLVFTVIYNLERINYTETFIGDVVFSDSVIEFAGLLTLLALIHLPSIQCRERCKCFKRACDQTPLLPNSGLQHTNPESVWDHANVPSVTVTHLPLEMSDCVTDATHHELQHETKTNTYAGSRNTPKYGPIN